MPGPVPEHPERGASTHSSAPLYRAGEHPAGSAEHERSFNPARIYLAGLSPTLRSPVERRTSAALMLRKAENLTDLAPSIGELITLERDPEVFESYLHLLARFPDQSEPALAGLAYRLGERSSFPVSAESVAAAFRDLGESGLGLYPALFYRPTFHRSLQFHDSPFGGSKEFMYLEELVRESVEYLKKEPLPIQRMHAQAMKAHSLASIPLDDLVDLALYPMFGNDRTITVFAVQSLAEIMQRMPFDDPYRDHPELRLKRNLVVVAVSSSLSKLLHPSHLYEEVSQQAAEACVRVLLTVPTYSAALSSVFAQCAAASKVPGVSIEAAFSALLLAPQEMPLSALSTLNEALGNPELDLDTHECAVRSISHLIQTSKLTTEGEALAIGALVRYAASAPCETGRSARWRERRLKHDAMDAVSKVRNAGQDAFQEFSQVLFGDHARHIRALAMTGLGALNYRSPDQLKKVEEVAAFGSGPRETRDFLARRADTLRSIEIQRAQIGERAPAPRRENQ